MKKTTRTFAAFDERQLAIISDLKKAFAGDDKKEISNKEIFMLGMAVGFSSKNKISDLKRSNTGVRIQYFQPDDNTLLAALQVHITDDPTALVLIEDLYDLAEQYAAGGIAILATALDTERNFNEWFQSLVFSNLEKNINND